MDMEDKLALMPLQPGVYLMKMGRARFSTSAKRKTCATACARISANRGMAASASSF